MDKLLIYLGNISVNIDGVNTLEDFKDLVSAVTVDDTSDTITIEFKNGPDTPENPAATTTLYLKYTGIDSADAGAVDLQELSTAIADATDVGNKFDILTGQDQDTETEGIQPALEFDFT